MAKLSNTDSENTKYIGLGCAFCQIVTGKLPKHMHMVQPNPSEVGY